MSKIQLLLQRMPSREQRYRLVTGALSQQQRGCRHRHLLRHGQLRPGADGPPDGAEPR